MSFLKTEKNDSTPFLQSDEESESDGSIENTSSVPIELNESSLTIRRAVTPERAPPITESMSNAPRKLTPIRYYFQDVTEKAANDIDDDINERNILTYKRRHANIALIAPKPQSFGEAIGSKEKDQWQEAIQHELESLKRNGTFGPPSQLPEGRKAVGYKWVFKTKRHQDVSLDKYKARLVAKGFTQRGA